jgi:hypothetical protein
VIALVAEVKVCQTLCTTTGGTHTVILHRRHLVEALLAVCTPPPSTATGHVTRLIRLGFPQLLATPGPCACCVRCSVCLAFLPGNQRLAIVRVAWGGATLSLPPPPPSSSSFCVCTLPRHRMT